MNTLDRSLIQTLLAEIEAQLDQGVLPLHSGCLEHLSDADTVLDYLLLMKSERMISGNLITKRDTGAPHRLTNIRLTYVGIKALHQNGNAAYWTAALGN